MRRNALIIGGSSGIGLASAKKLAREGFDLHIVHRDRRSVLELFETEVAHMKAEGAQVSTFNLDATNKDKIASFCGEIKETKFSLVLHSVSRGNLKNLISEDGPELSEEDIMLTVDAMALNVFSWVKNLLKADLFTQEGRIVTLTSAGSQKYWSGYAAVAIAKASLEILTKYLAVELSHKNIRANVINAGITDTPSLKLIPGYDTLIKEAAQRNPNGRLTQPEDVANVVYLLSTPEASWINGSIINVDGGENLTQ
ncbi:MAG: SDR family oxidoreductase [Cyclobacteriaceae bacterium]